MLTIFTIPKPFRAHINIIQRNAIRSWLLLPSRCEIILFGNEEGVAEVAAEFDIRHVPEIEKNEFGTPLFNSAFNQAQKLANNPLMTYINTDIILMSDFISAIQRIKNKNFMMVSRRWELDIEKEIKFNEADWGNKLRDRITKEGIFCGPSAIDYFVFPRDTDYNFPTFAIGRFGYDNWFLYRAYFLRIPIIDATPVTTAIHQKHDYSHFPQREKIKIEFQNNLKSVGGLSHAFTLRDVSSVLTRQGLKRRKLIPPVQYCRRYFFNLLSLLLRFYPYFNLWRKILLFPEWLLVATIRGMKQFLRKRRII